MKLDKNVAFVLTNVKRQTVDAILAICLVLKLIVNTYTILIARTQHIGLPGRTYAFEKSSNIEVACVFMELSFFYSDLYQWPHSINLMSIHVFFLAFNPLSGMFLDWPDVVAIVYLQHNQMDAPLLQRVYCWLKEDKWWPYFHFTVTIEDKTLHDCWLRSWHVAGLWLCCRVILFFFNRNPFNLRSCELVKEHGT